MRVIEPRGKKQNKKAQFSLLPALIAAVLFVALILVVRVIGSIDGTAVVVNTQVITDTEENNEQKDDELGTNIKSLEDFSGDELRLYYDNLVQPGLNLVEIPPAITGNDIADTTIRQQAELRGYKLRAEASAQLYLAEGLLVQNPVVEAWKGLKQDVAEAGQEISLTSGFRSIVDQRSLFNSKLRELGVSVEDIVNGIASDEVDEALERVAPPGYSKHHTGYTIDVICTGYAFFSFSDSSCFDIISADNYAIAKKNGFIPSYPSEANNQGPNPEAWEYVWVGDGE